MNSQKLKERMLRNSRRMFHESCRGDECAILIGENRGLELALKVIESLEEDYESLSELHYEAVEELIKEVGSE